MRLAEPDDMAERPWMPMYWGDYLRDTMHLTTEAHGAYILLIAAYWTAGKPLPDNDRELARIARVSLKKWRGIRPQLDRFFVPKSEGILTQKRIEKELAQSRRRSDLASAAARVRHMQTTTTTTRDSESVLNACERNKESAGASNGKYRFSGAVIRLTDDDYRRWQKAYHAIDLTAELTALDDFYAGKSKKEVGNWFMRASAVLAKKHETRLSEQQAAKPKWVDPL